METTVGALLWSFCRSSLSLSRCEFPTFIFKLSLQSLPFLPIFSLPNYFPRNHELCQRAFCPRKSNSFGFCPGFCGQPFNLGTLILEWILGETNPLAGRPLRLVVKAISRTQMISWPRRFHFWRPTIRCPFLSVQPSLGLPSPGIDHCPPLPISVIQERSHGTYWGAS